MPTIQLFNEDNQLIDLTESVACLYDALLNSMDWGSEFLCSDDVEALVLIGTAMGWALPPEYQAKLRVARATTRTPGGVGPDGLQTDKAWSKTEPR